jgi:hypothetical protein
VFQCRVSDRDEGLEGRSHEVVVKILADRKPSAPTGTASELVEFEGLQVTPYVDNSRCQGKGRCGARMAFSLRATGIKAGRPSPSPARTLPDERAAGHHGNRPGPGPLRGGESLFCCSATRACAGARQPLYASAIST